ncbi:hypothetical protein MNBD_ACTINO02-488, partial [hydrothermal vent metagenome]
MRSARVVGADIRCGDDREWGETYLRVNLARPRMNGYVNRAEA